LRKLNSKMPKAKKARPPEPDYSHRSLLDKLGVTAELSISILGVRDAHFLKEISGRKEVVAVIFDATKLGLSWHERAIMGVTFLILLSVEITIADTKHAALFFASLSQTF